MKLVAVMMVRNEAPVLPVNLAYHRALGVDEFWILDNGSSDGTADILDSAARSHGDIRWRADPSLLDQAEVTTVMASEAIEAGADWILPIDADEFWWSGDRELRSILDEDGDTGALVCGVDNFVQRRSTLHEQPDSLVTMTYRAEPIGTMESARELVESGTIGFVEIVYPPKVIARASGSLVMGPGNHSAENLPGSAEPCPTIRVLHAPIRSRAALVQRAEHGRRKAAVHPNPITSWHLRRWARMDDEGTLNDDWNANSQRFGRLDAGGIRRRLVRDLRLKRAVAPFVKSVR